MGVEKFVAKEALRDDCDTLNLLEETRCAVQDTLHPLIRNPRFPSDPNDGPNPTQERPVPKAEALHQFSSAPEASPRVGTSIGDLFERPSRLIAKLSDNSASTTGRDSMKKVLAIMTLVGFTTGCMTPMHPVPIRVATAPEAMVYANDRLLGSPSDDMPRQSTGFPEADIWYGADYSTWVNEDTGVGYLYARLEGSDDETIVARCGDETSSVITVERAPHWPAVIDGLSKVLAFVPVVGMLMPVAWDVPYQDVKLDIDDCESRPHDQFATPRE